MAKTERQTEITERHRIAAPDGQLGVVEARTTFMRIQYLDLSWSEWQVEVTRFFWGRTQVNLREDGNWETPEISPRLLTRQA